MSSLRRELSFLIVVISCCPPTSFGQEAEWKERIRTQALINLSRIQSLDVRYEATSPDGDVAEHRLWLSGTMARSDKVQTKAASGSIGNDLYRSQHAFNNLRSQFIESKQRTVTLKDGNLAFFIPTITPVAYPYSWVRVDEPFRWDKLLDEVAWEKTFENARLEHGVDEHSVVFMQNEKHEIRVQFDPQAMYLPVRVDRIRREDGLVVGSLVVNQWATVGNADEPICIATDIVSERWSTSQMSMQPNYRIKVLPGSLAVNIPLESSLFTLALPDGYQVHDVDEVDRYAAAVKEINATVSTEFAPPSADRFGFVSWCGAVAIILLGGAAVARWRHSKAA